MLRLSGCWRSVRFPGGEGTNALPTFISTFTSGGQCIRSRFSTSGKGVYTGGLHCRVTKTTPSPQLPQSILLRLLPSSISAAIRAQQTRLFQNSKTAWQKALQKHRATKMQSDFYQSGVALLCPAIAGVWAGGLLLWQKVRTSQAECKAKGGRNRLVGDQRKEDNGEPEPKFPWRKLWALLLEDIWYLLLAVVSAIGAASMNIQVPILLGEVTNVVTKFTAQTVGNFLEEIKKPALKLIAAYIVQGALTFTYITLLSTVGENLAVRLRQQLFSALLQQDIAFFDTHKTGELMDRLTSDIQDFKSSFKMCISQGLKACTQTIGCVASLLLISPKLSSIMLVIIPAIICGGTALGSFLRKFSREAQDQIARSAAVADEAIGNIRTVRAFAMEDKENELYEQELALARQLNIRLGVGIGVFQGLSNIFLNSIILGSMFAGGWLISLGELSAGNLMSFLVATQMIERSLAQMSVLFGTMVRGVSAGARVFEYINTQPSVQLTGGKTFPYHSMVGSIQFKNVAFSYPTRPGQVVLEDFTLSVPGGRVVALVGLSGGGKSTVASLLERFYDVTQGSITIDGIDIRDLDPSWLRGRVIGFINQEPVLFATTVMENIRYGRPDATDEEVLEAAAAANAHDFITGFPNGYNTVLGERGVTVSGGQKQRIAIARALVKNPSILILDEATSALDAESEHVVQEALDKVTKGRTTLVIAHRLSTVRDAHTIAVVSHGKIVEMGDHHSLKKKKGLYWDLIKHQEIEEGLESS